MPITKAEYAKQLKDVLRPRCRGALSEEGRELVAAALADEDHELARRMDAKHRARCGHPLAGAMLARKLDGETQTAKCPNCGNAFKWTPPRIRG